MASTGTLLFSSSLLIKICSNFFVSIEGFLVVDAASPSRSAFIRLNALQYSKSYFVVGY